MQNQITRIELLAPARTAAIGRLAIDFGADAVYIGAPRFGARVQAGNSLRDIADLVQYAHRSWARVYVTLNTLLFDEEIPQAVTLSQELAQIGVDALIIQDVGLLESDLPPIPLIASTQMHNHTPERVRFLQDVGFTRVILARECTLTEIKAIRSRCEIELECFIHGALCVSYSGQCYLSHVLGGRSGNRGECAQPCRLPYHLCDRNGRVLLRDRHLLSLKDLNLTEHLGDLLDAGITSFKIEGRLKEADYVKNIVLHYRRHLDQLLESRAMRPAASGAIHSDLAPDPHKTFNRGYSDYFIRGRRADLASFESPKSIGVPLGRVNTVHGSSFTIDSDEPIQPGDGVSFFDGRGVLSGFRVHLVDGRRITPHKKIQLLPGQELFRNYHAVFSERLQRSECKRSILIDLRLVQTDGFLTLAAQDSDGNHVVVRRPQIDPPAEKPDAMLQRLKQQLLRLGETEFTCCELRTDLQVIPFLPAAAMNALRREVIEALRLERLRNRPQMVYQAGDQKVPFPVKHLTYTANVLNRRAQEFYRRHGVDSIEPAAESGIDLQGRPAMVTRYCLKHELGWCPHQNPDIVPAEPLFLVTQSGRKLRLDFDCHACVMRIIVEP